MALNGSISKAYSGYTYLVEWSAKQSISGNYSELTLNHKLVCKSSYDLYISGRTNSASVDGVAVSWKSPKISTTGGKTIALGTTTHKVQHNSDGSKKNVPISCTFNIKATISGNYKGSITASGSIDLDTIARASQPSCVTWPEHTQNVGDFGDTIAIHMNRADASFTHTVRYAYGDLTGTIATGVGTGTTWEIPLSFMDLIPNDTSGSGTIYVDTYSGSTKIGTKSCGFTANVPASVKPTCTVQVLDATDYQKKYGNLVKSLSKLYVKVNGYPVYSSPIASRKATANGKTYTSEEFTTDVLVAAGTTTVSATVTDKRGRTSAAASASFQVIDYVKPQVTALSVHRCTETGEEYDQGEYVQVTFSAKITPLNNKNSAVYELHYKKTTDENYTTVEFTELTGDYTVTDHSYIFAASSDYSYDVEIVATDDIDSTPQATSASTGSTHMDWGDGIAFGKVSERAKQVENAWPLNQIGNFYAFQPSAFNGTKGYTLLAEIKLNTLNVNAPIVFTINRRGALCPMHVYVRFASSSTTTDPDLGSITYEGDNYGAFLIKSAVSTWKLYVDNTSGWSNPCLQSWYTTDNQMARMSITFPSEQIEELPTPYWRATPAVLRSIIDCVMPVGFVLTLYSHANPSEMYPGTTWERIQNAFLWGCDESGTIGQTGGEKTHKLTIAEIPSHTHKYFRQKALAAEETGPDTKTAYASTTAVAEMKTEPSTYATGGGTAHNNMPPYVQVSIWRRTA